MKRRKPRQRPEPVPEPEFPIFADQECGSEAAVTADRRRRIAVRVTVPASSNQSRRTR